MAKVKRSILIKVPIEKAFSYMSNPLNQMEWLPGLFSVRNVTGMGVGQRFIWNYKMMGIPLKGEAICTECTPSERIVFDTTGSINSTWIFALKPQNDRTLMDFTVEYTIPVPGLGKLGEKLILWQNEREADLAMKNIKEWLEYRAQFKTY